MEKIRIIEYHWSESVPLEKGYINYVPEKETRWYIKRVLFKKFYFLWIPVRSQTIRMDANQAIASATLGDTFTYEKHWDPKLNHKPYKIKYT